MNFLSFPSPMFYTLPKAPAIFASPISEHLPEIGGMCAGAFMPPDGSRPYGIAVALLPEGVTPFTPWSEQYKPVRTSEWDGAANTRAILAADPSNEIARRIASLQVGEHRDYYWPSRAETDHIYNALGDFVLAAIEGILVWTSTQGPDSAFAWCQLFYDGSQNCTLKGAALPAVAVRRFEI